MFSARKPLSIQEDNLLNKNMTLCFHPFTNLHSHRFLSAKSSSGDPKEDSKEVLKSPAEQYAPLAKTFRRRVLVGVGSASLIGVGANFAGITSFLLGMYPKTSRNLKFDLLYPIQGYSRCIDSNEGFEFIYPATWVGDQTVLYRAAEKSEFERSLDPPPINNFTSNRRRRNVSEPVVAFGPPGSTGEISVSVIVSPVPIDFSIEAFGGAEEVGEAVVKTITRSSKRPDVKGSLIKSRLREDLGRNVKYYELEFRVESPSFQRHNIAVCSAHNGRLYTLNSQAPEVAWPEVKSEFHLVADSFTITS